MKDQYDELIAATNIEPGDSAESGEFTITRTSKYDYQVWKWDGNVPNMVADRVIHGSTA